METRLRAPDEDPDAALDVIMGRHRGSKAYAAICLADAIRHGDYPEGWQPMTRAPLPAGYKIDQDTEQESSAL
jgi:hypothetical protein